MRVLQVVHGFPPRSTAGVEVYTARLARELGRRGDDVRVLAAVHDLGSRSGSLSRRSYGGLEVLELANVGDHPGLEGTYAAPDLSRACTSVIDELRPDVVHVQHLLNLSIDLVEAARRQGAALVMTLHDYWPSCPRDGLRMQADGTLCGNVDHGVCARCLADSPHVVPALQRGAVRAARVAGAGRLLHRIHDVAPRLSLAVLDALRAVSPHGGGVRPSDLDVRSTRLRAALQSCDALVAPTRFVAGKAVEFGAPEERLRLIPHGVDLPVAARRGVAHRFGYVGGLSAHKGVHVLIEAFRDLEGDDLCLAVHGDPSVHPEYSARLRALATPDQRIRLCGPFSEGEQERVFAELDVAVVPSLWWENSPFSLLEARASGARVVASRTGGVPELVPEGAGRLVPPGDVLKLRHALAREAGRPASEVPAPRRLAEEVSELEALYRSLVAERRASGRAAAGS